MVLVLTHNPVDMRLPWVKTGPFASTDPPWSVSHPHMGVDLAFAGCEGAEAYAMADAVVVPCLNDGTFGNTVCLELTVTNGSPFRYLLYAHLRDVTVKIGQRVKGGQLIGHVGHTSTDNIGPHLHRQLCVNNQFPRDLAKNADPDLFLEEPMTPDERARLERIERLIGGWGIDVAADTTLPDGTLVPAGRVTGNLALRYLDEWVNNSQSLQMSRQDRSLSVLRSDVRERFAQVDEVFRAGIPLPPLPDDLLTKFIEAGAILGEDLTDPFAVAGND